MNVFQSKKCRKCGEEKPATIEFFYPHKGGRFGLRGDCRLCRIAYRNTPQVKARQKAYLALYQISYRESGKKLQKSRAWRANNLAKARAATLAWQARNRERATARGLRWRTENREKARAKQRRADTKLQLKPSHVLKKRIKARVRQMLKGKGHSFGSLEKILGYTRSDLIRHIERQFTEGMTWDLLVSGGIHIDHIIPVSKFKITSITDADFKTCWGLTNLRPLWARDNQQKQAKVLTLL